VRTPLPCGISELTAVLKGEIEISMRLLGVTRVDQLGPEYLNCEKL
jgi:isopentenyl diphosphate isomerase/L-lactate dehydrogenase-like FMN-dependent dehydrogenase